VASTYRPVVDPEYTNGVAAPRLIVPPSDPDAQYDYHGRPDFVPERVAELSNTGDTGGAPLITLHGTLDALLPISTDSDVYADMVRGHGHGDAFRYYVIEGGTHVDPKADDHPEVFRPILPCFLDALDRLDAWVVSGTEPPPSGFVPFPADASEEERANTCGLPAPLDRVAGDDRIGTAIAASRAAFGITPTVVIAAADRFPDALAAAPLAAHHDAPVLLVRDELTEALRDELHRLGAVSAVVVGGTAAVPDAVVEALTDLGLEVERIAGRDRYATAAAIARALPAGADEAVVASGETFADALSAAPLAAAAGTPILLTPPAELHPATADVLSELGTRRTLVVGGARAVSEAVAAQLPAPRRVAGADRYETSVAVARLGLERGHSLEEVYIATGRDFADALAAAPVATAGEWGAVPRGLVLLVDPEHTGRSPATALLRSVADDVRRVLLLGGQAAIPTGTEDAIRAAISGR
ncbi:MAG: cell wall-binding repeat-containing protein, partial [Actinobacteria bacterium]|nr:cell wall-binding repeat-containing protein [Actinomycetota bacterium]